MRQRSYRIEQERRTHACPGPLSSEPTKRSASALPRTVLASCRGNGAPVLSCGINNHFLPPFVNGEPLPREGLAVFVGHFREHVHR